MKTLIVDDNATNRKLLRVTLEAEGLDVVEASDGVNALAVMCGTPVDAVITDILMPRMDGYRFCYEVRNSKLFCDVPLIVYTNTYTSPGDEKTGLDLGADRFLRKPSQAGEIAAALRALKEQPRRARSGQIPAPRGLELMKEYSEALVRKLEEKNADLQLAAEQLTQMNLVLKLQKRDLEKAREDLRTANEELEGRVRSRTAALESANRDLESFGHSVAHDLRAPLRAIDGFSRILMEECGAQLNPQGRHHFQQIVQNIRGMNQLIDELLKLSRIGRSEMKRSPVNLSALARTLLGKLQETQPDRQVEIVIAPDIIVPGDEPLLRIALENLLNNAWKFTGKREKARIEFGFTEDESPPACFVRDNGAGFDMAYAGRLFGPFQRLHPESEFPGTGIGLATVQRIIHGHGGRIRAESVKGEGTTFYFTL